MEKKFCKFLTKIGMIDEDTSSTFIKIYKDIFLENTDINIFELSFQILITFLNNITNSQKNYMCHNLPLKFYELREKNKKEKLISILIKNRLKNKIRLLKHLFIWKNNSKNKSKDKMSTYKKRTNPNSFNKSNTSFKRSNQTSSSSIYKIPYPNYHSNANMIDEKLNNITEQDLISIDNNNTYKKSNSHLFLSNTAKNSYRSGSKKFHNNINNINYKELNKSSSGDKLVSSKKEKKSNNNNSHSTNNINTTWGYKEQKELNECTFKPKINNLKKNSNSLQASNKQREEEIQSRFDKLYYDDVKYKLSKQMKAIEYDHWTNKELTFNPNINNIPNFLKEEREEKFENRMKTYLDIKNKHNDEMQRQINEEFNKMHSFSPQINNSRISKSYSNNSIFFKAINDKNESENMSTIPAYIRLYEESKLRNQKKIQREKEVDKYMTSLSNSLIKNISVVNINKINELYENRDKSKNSEKIRNKVESEEGVTFKPYIYKNKFTKNIYSNFYERNSRFLEDKEKFINLHQRPPNQNPKKKISQNEKKEIVKNIVDRLYNESKFGTISNNSIGCNKYIKSVQGNYNNIHIGNKINNNFPDYDSVE